MLRTTLAGKNTRNKILAEVYPKIVMDSSLPGSWLPRTFQHKWNKTERKQLIDVIIIKFLILKNAYRFLKQRHAPSRGVVYYLLGPRISSASLSSAS